MSSSLILFVILLRKLIAIHIIAAKILVRNFLVSPVIVLTLRDLKTIFRFVVAFWLGLKSYSIIVPFKTLQLEAEKI